MPEHKKVTCGSWAESAQGQCGRYHAEDVDVTRILSNAAGICKHPIGSRHLHSAAPCYPQSLSWEEAARELGCGVTLQLSFQMVDLRCCLGKKNGVGAKEMEREGTSASAVHRTRPGPGAPVISPQPETGRQEVRPFS